jgi:nucleoside-diphosphate-sugar epimerase
MVNGFEIAAKHENAPGEIFIMAGPKAVTIEELANGIAECVGVEPPTLRFPKALVWTGVVGLEAIAKITSRKAPFSRRSIKFYTGNTAFSIERAEKLLNFKPKTHLSRGLHNTYLWLQEKHQG